MAKTVRIGVFDSGIGGLTVLRPCAEAVSGCTFYYLGDNRNAPYGEKPEAEIYALTRAAVLDLRKKGADVVVLACNTATAVCADRLRAEFSFPILGTEPAILPAARAARRVLVLATPRTAESRRLKELVGRCPQCSFTVFPAAGLAAAVESLIVEGTPLSLEDHLLAGDFDGVVLGCTHYVFLRRAISAFYGAPVFDGGEGVAKRLKTVLSGRFQKSVGLKNHDCQELNICKIPTVFPQKSPKNRMIFLGSCKNANKCVYKQMFDSKFTHKFSDFDKIF